MFKILRLYHLLRPQQAKHLKAKKEEGNLAFKKGNLPEALKLYSEALEIDPQNKATNAKLYFNRATVQARLSNNQEAIADCSQVGWCGDRRCRTHCKAAAQVRWGDVESGRRGHGAGGGGGSGSWIGVVLVDSSQSLL